MATKSQTFPLFDDPVQMEPLLPGERKSGPLLEQAGDFIREADQLAGMCRPGALTGLRTLLRAMNSYYSNKIEGQHTLPLEIIPSKCDDAIAKNRLARIGRPS